MDMRTYLNSLTPQDRETFAGKCETTVDYFWQIAGKHRNAGPALAKRINKHSGGAVTLQELRPDIYGEPSQDSAA
jgi:DNA-binding transcriptional regulator YdaS (Cro superfamily)